MENGFDIKKLVRENVANLKPYSSARDEFTSDGEKMVFLDANENPFENEVNRYPDPQQGELKFVIGRQKNIPVSQILLGNGSDEVLDLIFRAFCEPKIDNVISLAPTYGMYKVLANINAIEDREVLLDHDFQPELGNIFDAVDENTKLIFLCSPNNPTGNSFSERIISEILGKFKGLVVIDEAYIDFSSQRSWTEKLQEYPNLIVTQTLSKAYGMAGIRLGICFASEEVIELLNKIKPPYNVNSLTQKWALKGISESKELREKIEEILEQRNCLITELQTLGFIQKIYPSDANFLLVKVDDANKRYQEILENGVVVRNRTKQALCENTLRFTVGTASENKRLLKILKKLDK